MLVQLSENIVNKTIKKIHTLLDTHELNIQHLVDISGCLICNDNHQLILCPVVIELAEKLCDCEECLQFACCGYGKCLDCEIDCSSINFASCGCSESEENYFYKYSILTTENDNSDEILNLLKISKV